jgi:hypothetical protein
MPSLSAQYDPNEIYISKTLLSLKDIFITDFYIVMEEADATSISFENKLFMS